MMCDTKAEVKNILEEASCCLAKGELDEAAELCAAATRRAPRNARACYLRGAVAQRAGRGREAAEYACEAARLRPNLPALQLAAGSLLYRGKEYASALRVYETAIEKDPADARYHLGAAASLRKLGRCDEATASLLRAAATADPRDAHVHYKLGQHLRSVGGVPSCALAAEAYGRALALDPGHALAAFWLQATRKRGAAVAAATREKNESGAAVAQISSANYPRPNAAEDLSQTTTPLAAPREYVVGLYNSYAETFDSHLQGSLGYRTPTVIVETLGVLFPGKRWRRCLDLGCGTGLSGQAASAVCHRLAGVDLSPAMVRQARQKKVYHRLLVGDVTDTVASLCRASGSGSGSGNDSGRGGRDWTAPEAEEEEGGAPRGEREQPNPDLDLDPVGEAGSVTVTGTVTGTGNEKGIDTGTGEGEEGSVTATVTGTVKGTITGIGGVGDLVTSACVTPAVVTSAEANGGEACGGDLVLSCDVFGYIGDLRPCFEAVRGLFPREAGGGDGRGAAVFAFSAEAPPAGSAAGDAEAEGGGARGRGGRAGGDAGGSCQAAGGLPGYELQGTGSREYLERVCREASFRVLESKDVVLRKNAGAPVRGFVFVAEAAGKCNAYV